MKNIFLFVLVAMTLAIFSANAQAQDTTPVVTDQGPINLEGGAYSGSEQPTQNSEICRQANKVRTTYCQQVKLDCKAVLAAADAQLMNDIVRCPVFDDPTPFTGESLVGAVPCCVAMGQNGQ